MLRGVRRNATSDAAARPVPALGGRDAGGRPAGGHAALDDLVTRRRAYSVLTLLQEGACVLGPALVGLLAAVGSSSWALGTAAGLACFGAAGFALLPAIAALGGSEAPTPGSGAPRRRVRVPRLRAMRPVLVVSAFCGIAFGGFDVAVPAFASAEGDVAAAGYLLAALAAGIGAGALLCSSEYPVTTALLRRRSKCPRSASTWLCGSAIARWVMFGSIETTTESGCSARSVAET